MTFDEFVDLSAQKLREQGTSEEDVRALVACMQASHAFNTGVEQLIRTYEEATTPHDDTLKAKGMGMALAFSSFRN